MSKIKEGNKINLLFGDYPKECWGKIETDANEMTQKIFVIKSVFDKQLKENGFNSQSFLSWAKQKNLIETDGERFTKKKKIQSIATNCVCILYNLE